jgi:hypothetical protein
MPVSGKEVSPEVSPEEPEVSPEDLRLISGNTLTLDCRS